jgi:zinc transport system permease protein
MNEIFEIFQFIFFQKALLAALLASISCGIIGTYIVSKRIVFISGGITHASFGGIGIGYFLGINPILGALVFGILSAIGIEFFTKKTDVRSDSSIAIFWALGMAVGIIFIFITPGYAPNLMSYLFGSILTVTNTDLTFLLVNTILIVLVFLLLYKTILYLAFDEEYAKTHHLPIQLINYLLISLTAATIVFNIKLVGIILVISLLTIPQTIANMFTSDFKKIIFASIIIGIIGSFSGLIFSYLFDIPSGATIIFFLVILFIIARFFKYLQIKLIKI